VSCGRASAYGYFEGRIIAQSIQVVTVLVSCCNGHGSGGDHSSVGYKLDEDHRLGSLPVSLRDPGAGRFLGAEPSRHRRTDDPCQNERKSLGH